LQIFSAQHDDLVSTTTKLVELQNIGAKFDLMMFPLINPSTRRFSTNYRPNQHSSSGFGSRTVPNTSEFGNSCADAIRTADRNHAG
jgi:hypothetical protein